MSLSEPAICIENVVKRFAPPSKSAKGASKGVLALNDLSLDIKQGEFFGLLGPNGAGKSTLINALAGLLNVDSGRLSVHGHDVKADYRLARQNLGVVPQEIVIDPFFTVRETLQFQSGYFGIRNNEKWIDELLEQLNLIDKQHTNMRQLSGGMKRRVLIAQALVHKPPVLVLDEPTAGVDVELRQSMWRFVRGLHQEGHTIVLTTHYLEEAEELCDRIAIINQGELIALETKQDLLARGLGSKLLVRTEQTVEKTPASLAGRAVAFNGTELEMPIYRDSDSIMDILDGLRHDGLQINYVSVLNDSLEDVFVQLTTNKTEGSQTGTAGGPGV